MKFNCGPTREEKIAAKQLWHSWFAWFPVRVASGDCRWLELIERRSDYVRGIRHGGWVHQYRAPQL